MADLGSSNNNNNSSDSGDSPPKLDLIETTIGNFGKWQMKISLLMSLLKFPIAWVQMSIIFLAPPTQFWCQPPEMYRNLTQDQWLAMKPEGSSPLEREGLNTGYCRRLQFENENNSDHLISCGGYDYNRSIFHSSIVSEWDLVCDDKRLVDVTQITLMLGVLIGNIFFGIFSDRQGRKKTLMICIILQTIFGLAAVWIPWFWAFILLRFLLAIANGGITCTSFVMCMEVVGGVWGTIIPILYQIPYGVGNSIMAGLAYWLRDWRDLQLAMSSLSAFYILYWWLVPESPRWLIATGRLEEGIAILENAARSNSLDSGKVGTLVKDFSASRTVSGSEKNRASISSLFATKELRKRSVLLYINWVIVGITFFAFSQYLGNIGSNLYFTAATSGLVAIPGTVLCIFVVQRFGRRWSIAIPTLVTGLCFFGILAVPLGVYSQDWPRVVIAGLGIVGTSISLPALYLYSGELFPTTIRNAGIGFSLVFSRIGSVVAPFVITLQDQAPYLPLLVLGVVAVTQALLILPLPETKGLPLPETIHDLHFRVDKVNQKSQKSGNISFISSKDLQAEEGRTC